MHFADRRLRFRARRAEGVAPYGSLPVRTLFADALGHTPIKRVRGAPAGALAYLNSACFRRLVKAIASSALAGKAL